MKKITFILLFAALALGGNAQLLWKVSGNGLKKPSYIFGTHHLAPISFIDSVAGFHQAFEQAEHVIGELVMADMMSPESMTAMQKAMLIDNDTTLRTLYTPEEYETIHTYVKENLSIDLDMANKLKPAFINMNIAVVLAMKTFPEFNPQQQLDAYLQTLGAEKKKKIGGLETAEVQYNALFNSSSLQRQAELVLCTLNNIEHTMEQTRNLTEAYKEQNLDKLLEITKHKNDDNCDPLPGEMEALIDNRNIAWAEKLPKLMAADACFVVVGAGHLPGEKGVLELLRNAGYGVEAVK